MLAGMVSQHGIHTIRAVFDGWVAARHAEAGMVTIGVAAKKFFTICQSVREADVFRCSPVASPYTQTFIVGG